MKTAKLTGKSVKGSLRSSAVKTIEVSTGKATQAKTKKAYKRIFAKANCGKNVRVV